MSISEQLWRQILNLKEQCDTLGCNYTLIGFSADKICFIDEPKEELINQFQVLISCERLKQIDNQELIVFSDTLYLYFSPDLDKVIQDYMCLYLPLATTRMHHKNRTFVIVHMAQSLDGKICTESGSSKWIGNDENLIHAHRIRALVDGVIVGGNTARQENPSLSVRHVEGPNPARILLCNSLDSLEQLPQVLGMRNFLLCNEKSLSQIDESILETMELKSISYCCKNGQIDIPGIFSSLLEEGIQSLMLEGGPKTIETFLQCEAVNWIQLHIAPLVFGSGKSFIALPEIQIVDDAKKLSNVFYSKMGDAIMVTGQI